MARNRAGRGVAHVNEVGCGKLGVAGNQQRAHKGAPHQPGTASGTKMINTANGHARYGIRNGTTVGNRPGANGIRRLKVQSGQRQVVCEPCLPVHPGQHEAEGELARPTDAKAGPTGEEWQCKETADRPRT
jgi:hypothetical protein